MASSAQIELWQADKVASHTTPAKSPNGIQYAAWGETRLPEADLERLIGAVPATMAPALTRRAYFFVLGSFFTVRVPGVGCEGRMPVTMSVMISAAWSSTVSGNFACSSSSMFLSGGRLFAARRAATAKGECGDG